MAVCFKMNALLPLMNTIGVYRDFADLLEPRQYIAKGSTPGTYKIVDNFALYQVRNRPLQTMISGCYMAIFTGGSGTDVGWLTVSRHLLCALPAAA